MLSRLETEPRVIFVLRKPSERVYSSFRFAQHNRAGLDPRLGFARYWRLLRDGALEELRGHFYRERSFYVLSRDVRYSRYVEDLVRWRERFDPGRLHLVLFEHLREEPRRVVSALAEAAGLDPRFYDDDPFEPSNETIRVRSHRLHRWVRAAARALPKNRSTMAAYRFYLGLQRRGKARVEAEDREALRELDRYFRPFNQRLAEELGMDLGLWQSSAALGRRSAT